MAVAIGITAACAGLLPLRRELGEEDPYGFTAEVHASWDRVRRGVR